MRLGIVPFLNLKPLIGLYERQSQPEVNLVAKPPSQLLDLLQQGGVEASFIASVDYLRHQDKLLLEPHFGVAAQGSVASVLLLCRKPIDTVEEILVDDRSSTSTAVLKVLLHHKFHLNVPIAPGDVTQRPDSDAFMVIGDQALEIFEGYDRIYDLGDEWTSWTGLPFIFGLWVTREKHFIEPLGQLLKAGWEWTGNHWDEIIQAESQRTGLAPKLVQVYLQNHIRYELSQKDFEGLNRFRELLLLAESETSVREMKSP